MNVCYISLWINDGLKLKYTPTGLLNNFDSNGNNLGKAKNLMFQLMQFNHLGRRALSIKV